ncbi:hypothetical protein [Paraburkholderia azotifigens]|uniref:PAS domain-containing protein n=1 Tax=Paraburkholderia azotifigens TaxID=2057004 RepID=A0ABU9RD16_9BURK|nr:hypothetical protein [Paraburkholderia azotifigens]
MKVDFDVMRKPRALPAPSNVRLAAPFVLSVVASVLAVGIMLAVVVSNDADHAGAARAAAPAAPAANRDEARMTGIIPSSMEAIIMIDEAQNIVIFNPTAERIFGIFGLRAAQARIPVKTGRSA